MKVPFSLPRTLIAVLTVAVVLCGLVAMHSMSLTTSVHLVHSVQSVHSVQAHGHAEQGDDLGTEIPAGAVALSADAQMAHLPMPVADCSGLDCLMLGMACVMALLTVALTLLRRGPTMSNLLGTTAARPVDAVAPHFSLSRSPSLVALSISRT